MVKKVLGKSKQYAVVVIGAGPAGLMTAGISARNDMKVLVVEKNDEIGKKLLLTGGGRCNLSNREPDVRKFVSKFGDEGSVLFSPLSIFGIEQTIKFFENIGLKTKTEEYNRVFPISDKSSDVRDILVDFTKKNGVEFKMFSAVTKVNKKGKKIVSIELESGEAIEANNFVVATGGLSHQETGSTGDGFKWLKDIGHKIVTPNPSLVPIKIKESWVKDLSGTALDNVSVSILENGVKNLTKKGRILFTHEGLSGPTILNMSKSIGESLSYGETKLSLDLMPGVGLDVLHAKMLKLFEEHSNKRIKNLVIDGIPAKVFEKILEICEIDGEVQVHSIFREERFALIEKFKKLEVTVTGLLGFDKAIVSSGGVDVKEVDFKTMRSKLFDNLYLVGDILNLDRPSGGYSLQLCWTTGYVAGSSVKI